MQKKIFLFIFALLLIPLISQAAVFEGKRDYILPQNQIIDQNLYVAGSNLTLSGSVYGDVLGAGGNLLLTGSVSEDVTLAGGTINLLGEIGGDVRIIGGDVIAGGNIGGDLVIIGASVKLLPDISVDGGAMINGSNIIIEGEFQKTVKINAKEVLINGFIAEDLQVKAEKITVGDNAIIKGNLSYSAPEEAIISSSAVIEGETMFNQVRGKGYQRGFRGFWSSAFGIKFLILFISGLIAILVFKRYSKLIISQSLENIGQNMGIGFLVLIGLPVVSIILLLTMIGSLIGGIAAGFFALMVMIAKVYAGIVFGFLLFKLYTKNRKVPEKIFWQVGISGIVILSVLSAIPIFGWAIGFIFFLLVFGTLSKVCYNRIRSLQ